MRIREFRKSRDPLAGPPTLRNSIRLATRARAPSCARAPRVNLRLPGAETQSTASSLVHVFLPIRDFSPVNSPSAGFPLYAMAEADPQRLLVAAAAALSHGTGLFKIATSGSAARVRDARERVARARLRAVGARRRLPSNPLSLARHPFRRSGTCSSAASAAAAGRRRWSSRGSRPSARATKILVSGTACACSALARTRRIRSTSPFRLSRRSAAGQGRLGAARARQRARDALRQVLRVGAVGRDGCVPRAIRSPPSSACAALARRHPPAAASRSLSLVAHGV